MHVSAANAASLEREVAWLTAVLEARISLYFEQPVKWSDVRQISPPDLVGASPATERTVRAHAAWAVLKDPVRRAAYDRRRASRDAGPSTAADDGSGSDGQVPSWGPGGVRPVSVAQLREAAARESAYSVIGRTQRAAFSAASRRIGAGIVLVGTIVLLLVALR